MKQIIILLPLLFFLSACTETYNYCPMPKEVSKGIEGFSELIVEGKTEEAIMKVFPFAQKGEPSSQVLLGITLYNSNLKKEKEAVSWLRSASEQGCIHGVVGLAVAYQDGRGVKKDLNKSFEWFLKLAESGHKFSIKTVSEMYRKGKGVEKSEKKADYWLEKSW